MKSELISGLEQIVGKEHVFTERDTILDYLVDETAPLLRPNPASDVVVVKPRNPHEVSKIIKIANTWLIPVFPRGAGTGLVGGAIPTEDGIVLSLERMNKIVEIDTENLMAVVEAGVPFSKLNDEAQRYGLFFPPHPGDETAQMGGIVACNAGGVRCVKYGVIRDYVKGVEVVLPTGEILSLGGKLLKNVTGYDLMHLLIGSQGTLGIITKVVVRLYPMFQATASLIIAYRHRREAVQTVPKILQQGITPLAVEYIERKTVEDSAKLLGKTWPCKEGDAFLYIIVAGEREEEIYQKAAKIYDICQQFNAVEGLIETSKRKQEDILAIRSHMYSSIKPHLVWDFDMAVPPANIEKMLEELDNIADKYGISIPIIGHAADGNLHAHIIEGTDKRTVENIKRDVYAKVKILGGVISGEHGIGKIRRKHLAGFLDTKEIEIMKAIKRVFDPKGILNPGSVIP